MTVWKSVAAAAAMTLASLSSYAGEYKAGDLMITETWTRATPPNAKAGGGFVQIMNTGSDTDRLTAVASDVAKKTEIHEMAVTDGVMKMRELEAGIEIPAGQTVTLKPGGLHIMFMGLNQSFEAGSVVPVVLTFEKAGDVAVDLAVSKMGAKTNAAMDHSKMDHGKMKKSTN